MSQLSLKAQITEDMKAAMRAKETDRLGTIRLLQAAIKQREVDERIELDDAAVLAVIDKMLKQRKESIAQYSEAGRDDLLAVEQAEVEIISSYMPEALPAEAVDAMVKECVAETGAGSIKDMGKVMAVLKPKLQGKADMAEVSKQVKSILAGQG